MGIFLLENCNILAGDVSKDSKIDSMDMYQIIQYLLGNYTLEENSINAADVSKDGKIDSMDMYLIIQYLLGNVEINNINDNNI